MRAVLCNSFGPPETLAVEDVPDPETGAGGTERGAPLGAQA